MTIRRLIGGLRKRADRILMKRAVMLGRPVPLRFRGRRYWLNPDASAEYHIAHSTEKIANMVDLIPENAKVVLDVGANCGLFAALAEVRCPGAAIHCFEPSVELLPFIRMNATAKVHVHGVAVGDREGKLELFVNRKAQQANSMNRSAVALVADDADIESTMVDGITLDQFAEANGISRVDVLKVDVQGYEGAVFRGARKLLPSVDMLFVESTWMDIESIIEMVPFALAYGFTHASVLNPVYMGVDILLSRRAVDSQGVKLSFEVCEKLLAGSWK